MKVTPGPWKFYKGKLRPKFSQVMIIEIRDKTGKSIVKWTGFDGVNLPKKEIEANTRLMAAAPELLEACKLMYAAWEQLMPNLAKGVVQDYELVLTKAPVACSKAIAKAEGGERP